MRTCSCLRGLPCRSLCQHDERPSPESTARRLAPRRCPAARRHGALPALEREEPALCREAAGISAEAPVGRDDAVAGDDDRDRVRDECYTGVALGLIVSVLAGDIAVSS